MRKIKFFLFFVIGLLVLTGCSLNHTQFPRNIGDDEPISGVSQYTITFKDFETKEVLTSVTKNEGNYVSSKDVNLAEVEGYVLTLVDENGDEVDLYDIKETSTVYVKATIQSYTVCFYEHGIKVKSESIQYGEDVALIDASKVAADEEFVGWYTENDGGELVTSLTMPAHTVELYAHYAPKTFTITYETGLDALAEVANTKEYHAGDRIGNALPEALENAIENLDKYTLLGWYKNPELTEKFTDLSMPAHDVTLYAKWSYAGISFKDGEQIISVAQGSEGQAVAEPVAPEKVGYEFAGWYLDPDFNTPAVFPLYIGNEEVNVYAKYVENANTPYKVEYYQEALNGSFIRKDTLNLTGVTGTLVLAPEKVYDGFAFDEENLDNVIEGYIAANGSLVLKVYFVRNSYDVTYANCDKDAETYKYGETISTPVAPSKTGYTFAGWDEDVPQTMPIGGVTLTATWNINQYTISFNSNGGSTVASITQDYNTAVTAPEAPTKTGYTFAGWTPAVPTTMPAENLELTASWTINQYTISFNSNGGSTVASITQDYNTSVTAPEAPTKTGYTFAGWSQAVPTTMPAENLELIASWTINQYTISFNSNGGSTVASITQDYNTAVTAPEAPTKTGYTFAGWTPTVPATMPAEDVELTASWTINQYTISFNSNGGSAVASITQDYNTSVTAPEAPTKTGYTFAGWTPTVPATMPAENLELTATWDAVDYAISYNLNGGSQTGAPTEYNIESEDITLPTPTKTGHTFKGWFDNNSFTGSQITTIAAGSTGDKAFYAKWQANTYAIIYKCEGGFPSTGNGQIGVTYGEAYTLQSSTKTGYRFDGWFIGDQKIEDGIYTWTESITVTAHWTINQYTISFNSNGGSVVASITQDYNTSVTAPANPTKTGYAFAGWTPAVPTTMPAENVELTATWTINQYTISFNDTDGSSITSITQDYNTAVTAPADPTKTGYTFAGWSQAVPTTMPAEDVELTASWTPITYEIAYNLNGGSQSNAPSSYNIESTAITLPTPTKEYYVFDGWYDNNTFSGTAVTTISTGSTGNKTFYAKWEAEQFAINYVFNDGKLAGNDAEIIADFQADVESIAGSTISNWNQSAKLKSLFSNSDMWAKWQWLVQALSSAARTGDSRSSYYNAIIANPSSDEGYASDVVCQDFFAFVTNRTTTGPMYGATCIIFDEDMQNYIYNKAAQAGLILVETYTIESDTITLPTLVKENFVFGGWYNNPEFTGDAITTLPLSTYEDVTLYAKFIATVQFELDGGNLSYATYEAIKGDFDKDYKALTGQTDYSEWKNTASLGNLFTQSNHKWDWLLDYWATVNTNSYNGVSNASVFQTMKTNGTCADYYYFGVETTAFYKDTQKAVYSSSLKSANYADADVRNAIWAVLSAKDSVSIANEGTYNLPTVAYKPGYNFVGWYNNAEFTGEPITSITGSGTAYALFVIPYDVTYELNDGSFAYLSREQMAAEFLKDYNNFASTHYTNVASYWSDSKKTNFWKDANMRAKWLWIWDDIKAIAKSQTIDSQYIDGIISGSAYSGYATQNVAIYLLGINATLWNETYKATYGSLSSSFTTINATSAGNSYQTYMNALVVDEYDTVHGLTLPTVVFKTGYDFAGWYDNAEFSGSKVTSISTGSTGNKTLYAKWTPKQFSIIYDANGGFPSTGSGQIGATYGQAYTLQSATKTGYSFDGWYLNDVKLENGTYTWTESITVVAHWTINQYTITFDTDGGNEIASITQNYGTSVTAPSDPVKSGYVFKGWDTTIPTTMPADDLTITAEYITDEASIQAAYEAGIALASGKVTTAEYTFAGTVVAMIGNEVYIQAGSCGIEIYSTSTLISGLQVGDRVQITSTIKNYNGLIETGTISEKAIVGTGAEITPVLVTDFSTLTQANQTTLISLNNLKYESGSVTVGASSGVNFLQGTSSIQVRTNKNLPDDVETAIKAKLDGLTVYDTVSFTGVLVGYYNGCQVTVFSADQISVVKGESPTATVTYTDGVNTYEDTEVPYGSYELLDFAETGLTTPEGKTFVNWTLDDVACSSNTIMVDGDITLEAVFEDEGNYVIVTTTTTIADLALAKGWVSGTAYTSFALDSFITISTTGTGNNGKFYNTSTPHSWRVYTTGSGNIIITAAPDCIITSYTLVFSGTLSGCTSNTAYNVSTNSITINASATTQISSISVTYKKPNIDLYTLSFDTDGGSTIDSVQYAEGGEVVAPSNPTKEGYTFAGWTPELPATMPAEDLEVTAVWEINQYTITFVLDNGDNNIEITQNYGTPIVAPTDPTKENFTFTGWDEDIPATMPGENMTITALWQATSADGTYKWVKVTDASSLKANDVVIIVASASNYAMSTTQNSNNRGQAAIVKNGNYIESVSSDVQQFTLKAGSVTGTFAFYTGDGYLYPASSSKNYLRTQTSLDDNASFLITITDGNASVISQGTYTRNTIKYNNNDYLFSCYASGQAAICIYRYELVTNE